jgi:F0F1-type ATP synthase assembly protein I
MDNPQRHPHANNHHHLALIVAVLVGGLIGLWMAAVYNTNIPAAVVVGALIGFVFVADLARRARDI